MRRHEERGPRRTGLARKAQVGLERIEADDADLATVAEVEVPRAVLEVDEAEAGEDPRADVFVLAVARDDHRGGDPDEGREERARIRLGRSDVEERSCDVAARHADQAGREASQDLT